MKQVDLMRDTRLTQVVGLQLSYSFNMGVQESHPAGGELWLVIRPDISEESRRLCQITNMIKEALDETAQ